MLWILIILTLLVAVGLYTFLYEPTVLRARTEQVVLDSRRLREPLHILFLSDIHSAWFSSPTQVRKHLAVLQKLHRQRQFDLILWGGDFLDHSPRYKGPALRLVEALAAWDVPMYGVMGNHDYKYTKLYGYQRWIAEIGTAGVTILRNKAVEVQIRGQRIELVGLEDLETDISYKKLRPWAAAKAFQAAAAKLDWYRQATREAPRLPRILLTHNPDGIYVPGPKADLVLAGHTHGGQYLPWRFLTKYLRFLPAPRGSFRTTAGRISHHGTPLVISSGMGSSTLPGRLIVAPEVAIIDLVQSAKS
jgi:uncharacterized protein